MPKHQTLHKEIKSNVLHLKSYDFVKKVVIGPYENCRHHYKPGTLKWQRDIRAGFKIAGYDGSGIYTFYVYLRCESYRETLRNLLFRYR